MDEPQKVRRGQPQFYEQTKSAGVFIAMTPDGLRSLDQKIHAYDPSLSRSEFLERLARGTLNVTRLVEVFFPLPDALIDDFTDSSLL